MDFLRSWETWCLKCDCLQFAKPALRTREGGLICVCGEPVVEVVVVPASQLEGAVERLAEAERLLSGALEPGAMGNPVRCFSRGEMADIEMALVAIRGQSG